MSTNDGRTFWYRQSWKAKVAIVLFIMLPIIASLAGFTVVKVIPSTLAITLGLSLAVVYAVGLVLFIEIGISRSDPHTREVQHIKARWITRTPGVRIPLMFCVGLMCGYSAAAWTLPWGINQMFGTSSERTFMIDGWFAKSGRRGCSHPEIGHGVFVDSPAALCVKPEAQANMGIGKELRLVGPATSFGINVEEIWTVAAR